MRHGNKVLAIVAALGCLALAVSASAQTSGGSAAISGTVKDTSGAVLPGVTVEAASPALIEKVRTVVTDEGGQYKLVNLPVGTYSVTFTLTGFNTVKRDGIELTTNFTAPVNVDLAVGSLQETVTVSGAAPVVDVREHGGAQRHFAPGPRLGAQRQDDAVAHRVHAGHGRQPHAPGRGRHQGRPDAVLLVPRQQLGRLEAPEQRLQREHRRRLGPRVRAEPDEHPGDRDRARRRERRAADQRHSVQLHLEVGQQHVRRRHPRLGHQFQFPVQQLELRFGGARPAGVADQPCRQDLRHRRRRRRAHRQTDKMWFYAAYRGWGAGTIIAGQYVQNLAAMGGDPTVRSCSTPAIR